MSEEETIIDHLERILFFNQRAGRELWFDKPKEVQEIDIANAERHLQEAIDYICTNQQKQGHWICDYKGDHVADYHCSECGRQLGFAFSTQNKKILGGRWKYCDVCGAKMKGETE